MKKEIRNTENTENKGRRALNDEELEQVSGGGKVTVVKLVDVLQLCNSGKYASGGTGDASMTASDNVSGGVTGDASINQYGLIDR